MKEDLKYEQQYENYYKLLQDKEKNEENINNKEVNNKDNKNDQIIKKNINNNNINKVNEKNDLDKNIIETIRKNQSFNK